jgi:NAD(P)-dependent dehydrogenase (short-subunit alcohol dehydrogenase family)
MDIREKVALVTGAGSGIGRASAIRLAAEGAFVAVIDLNEDGGRASVETIEAAGGRAAFFRSDISKLDDAKAMIDFAESTFGGLDILHNNAGIITPAPGYPDNDPAQWMRMVDINLTGVILGTQFAVPAMRKRGGGAIVNTASMAGIGYGYPPNPVYAATKGGVVLFTASLAPWKDLVNIRVNCICPGIVDTAMLRGQQEQTPEVSKAISERLAGIQIIPPEEIADVVVEFIRDDSLAGRAMMVRNNRPRELLRMSDMPRLF